MADSCSTMISSSHSTVVSKPRTLPDWFSHPLGTGNGNVRSGDMGPSIIQSSIPVTNEARPSSSDTSQNSNPIQAENHLTSSTTNENVGTSAISVEAEVGETFDDHGIDSTSKSDPVANHSAMIRNFFPIQSSDSPPRDIISSNVDSTCDNPEPSCSSSDNVTTSTSDPPKRLSCHFGANCYRRNVQHKAEFSHPGDADYENEEAQCSSSTDVNGNKPACWYGSRCYRKNKDHLEAFSHDFTPSGRPKRTTKIRVQIDSDSDASDELDDFSDSDEYDLSFIDDDESSEDFDSEDETPSEISDNSNASKDEDNSSKKRKRKTKTAKTKKRKEQQS